MRPQQFFFIAVYQPLRKCKYLLKVNFHFSVYMGTAYCIFEKFLPAHWLQTECHPSVSFKAPAFSIFCIFCYFFSLRLEFWKFAIEQILHERAPAFHCGTSSGFPFDDPAEAYFFRKLPNRFGLGINLLTEEWVRSFGGHSSLPGLAKPPGSTSQSSESLGLVNYWNRFSWNTIQTHFLNIFNLILSIFYMLRVALPASFRMKSVCSSADFFPLDS